MKDLSIIPDLDGRKAVAAALAAFDDVSERQSHATRALWETKIKLDKARDKVSQMIRDIEHTFRAEYDAITGYPDIYSPYQMYDDHLGCYRCEISGLPLRHDDDTVEYGDGEALACLVDARTENRTRTMNVIDDDLFRQEVAPIVARHMMGAEGDPEKLAEIYEALAHFLGVSVAQGCYENADTMGIMLEGLSSYMMEDAAEYAAHMPFLSQLKNRG